VVAGDDQDVGPPATTADLGVQPLEGRDLGREVAVLAGLVGVLVVEEEEVVGVPVGGERLHLVRERPRS
jgi:hypothetical protein